MDIAIQFKRLPHSEGLNPPTKSTKHSSGGDIYAACDGDIYVRSGESTIVPTGFCFVIPEGFEMQIRPRSGLAAKNQVTVLNSPGTVDADYRGEVKVILFNHGKEHFKIKRGDRIAQAVIVEVPSPVYHEIDEETFNSYETDRADGGFGSTGVAKNG